jgi:hypothetical protein
MKNWLGAAILFAAVGGCDTTNTYVNSNPDLAGASPAPTTGCTPNAKECVTSTLARVCPSDGSGWLAVQCTGGDTCDQGECSADVNTFPCTPGVDKFCSSDTTALVCNDSGNGFHMVTCPGATHCDQATGDCAGSCPVGSGQCLDSKTELKCNDGFTLTPSPCPTGQACSDTLGACAPAACDPSSPCTAVCGQKGVDPTNSDPGFFSFCVDSPTGFQWLSVPCTAPAACDPTAACNGSSVLDSCVMECTPGSVRCVDATGNPDPFGNTQDGQQVCDSNGKWGAVTLCDVAKGKSCIFDKNFVDLGCGDPICGGTSDGIKIDGYCVIDAGVSKLRACDNTGNLVPIDRLTSCNPGACLTDQTFPTDPNTGAKPGHCGVQCQTGDTRCDTNFFQSVQGCAANGLWSNTTTLCVAPTDFCLDSLNAAGRPRATCVVAPECDVGDTRCTDAAGTEDAAFDHIETCNAAGQWGAPVACVASHCANNPNGGTATRICLAQCVPSSTICLGAAGSAGPSPSPFPARFGTKSVGTCTTDGRPDPSPSPCPIFTTCRTGPNRSNAYGCVLCAGINEAGVADTRCPTPDSTTIEVCNATNDGWTTLQTCPGSATCVDEENPKNASPETCYLTDSDLKQADPSDSCDFEFGDGAPISCGGKSDCCATFCQPANDTAPAICI